MSTNSKTLSGRVAVVTGATSGIGLAIAKELAANGARVVLNGRRREKVDAAAATLNAGASSPRAVGVAGDCAEEAVIEALFDAAKTAFGAEADCAVGNAGRGLNGSVLTSDSAQWEEMIRTNLLGLARFLRAAARRMIGPEAPGATLKPAADWTTRPRDILTIGSVVGRHVSPFSSMYGSTKFAVQGLTEGLRREMAPRGVRVTLIAPAFVESGFQDVAGYTPEWFRGITEKMGPVLQPEDIARAAAFICAQPAHVHVSDILVRPTRQDYP